MRFIFTFILLFTGALTAWADTTDFYHVYFRGKKVGDFSEGQTIRLVLKADSITPYDSLFVDVFRDAPCGSGCTYGLLIFGNQGPLLVDTTQRSPDFRIPLLPLVEQKRKNSINVFHGYYTEFFATSTRSRVVSFEIRLE